MKKLFFLFLLHFSLFLFIPINAQATIWYVDNASTCTASCGTTWATAFNSIQSAVNNAAAEDEIWVSGTFALTAQIDVDISVYIYGGFDGTETMREQRDPDNNATTVDGQNSVRCFYITDNATLDGLTIKNGYADDTATSPSSGGGIYSSTSLVIIDCIFSSNIAKGRHFPHPQYEGFGGGLFFDGSILQIDECTFINNHGGDEFNYIDGRGGAVYINSGTIDINNSTFLDNSAGSDTTGDGGGIYINNASVNITDCFFSDNLAFRDWGGAVCIQSGITSIEDSQILSNIVDYSGAGIGNLYGTLFVTNCFFSGNSANYGGGICTYKCSSNIITNSVFSNNSGYIGGGICLGDPSISPVCTETALNIVTNCTFANNDAVEGGGIYISADNATITNCILWGNTASDGPQIQYYPPSAITATYCNIDQDGFAGSNGNIRQDPLFVEPSNENYRLQDASPCIDSGTSDNAPTTDIEGSHRYDDPNMPNTGGGTLPYYDMGAYERQTPTLIELSSFTAAPQSGTVIIEWITASEIDNAGFNLYRAEADDGQYTRINDELIPAEGTATFGAAYEFVDKNVQNRKTYLYMLEDVDLNGTSTMHGGSVSATPRLIY